MALYTLSGQLNGAARRQLVIQQGVILLPVLLWILYLNFGRESSVEAAPAAAWLTLFMTVASLGGGMYLGTRRQRQQATS